MLFHQSNKTFIPPANETDLDSYFRRIKNADANLVDVAPTILHILKVPIPKDMDGKVLREIFN